MEHAEPANPSSGGGYPQLVERAVAFVESLGSPVDEDRLIAHVFGNTSSPALWRSLLRTILDGQSRLVRRPDGYWTTQTVATGSAHPDEYVVVDVETTGLKPSQQRMIEIAIIRIAPDGEPLTWSTLVNPGRSIPEYIASLTGIRNDDVAVAPPFRDVAQKVVELIGDLPVVAHNADFDMAFINAELSRCGYARLVNRTIDTLALAQAVAPEARRLALPDVARALGVAGEKPHRALADANLTLGVFHVLLQRAASQGCCSLDDVTRLVAGQRPKPRPPGPTGRGRSILDKSHLVDIPNAPGVYIMRDKDDRVLYVGKSKDLRKRVASYYSQPLGYTRKLDGLLELLAKIDVEVVGTELESLILESQLIRRYRPRFNTIQRNAEQYLYIRVDASNPWPRVIACKDRAEDGAIYFGPFHSAGNVRDAVDLVNDILPLRTCKRSFADSRSYGRPCIELSLKRCAGPCVGVADSDAYKSYIQDVLAFFRGDTSKLIAHLHRRLEETVATLDFERAARLRDQIQRVNRVVLEQVRLNEAARHGHALLVLASAEPGSREVWYLVRGQRWAVLSVRDAEDPATLAQRLAPIHARALAGCASVVPNHHSVDELALLSRFMRKTPEHPALIPLPATMAPLAQIAEQILHVDLSQPFGVAPVDGTGAPRDDDNETWLLQQQEERGLLERVTA